jgi:hypothetical protein
VIPHAGRSGAHFPARVGNSFLPQNAKICSGTHSGSYSVGNVGTFPGGESDGTLKLTFHVYPVPTLRMSSARPLLIPYDVRS